jgi:uncharacterized protein YyaL (SSP411 family)
MTKHQRSSSDPTRPTASARTPWLPWMVGAAAIGLFATGSVLFAQRTGHLDWVPGVGPPELRNQLADATSPYLRSAAEQPVHWQQWGPEAFELAAELDRPIWLDIGAIWCHWCHVMDRESYEDPEIAALINQSFVPVKVDRDERPDIDSRYQTAHAVLNGRGGGWPLTMFLTPSGEPFAGGTYFPPDSRGGRPGLRQAAPRVAAAYHQQRGEVTGLAQQVRQVLSRRGQASYAAGELAAEIPREIAEGVGDEFDPQYGGFGKSEGPKFPGGEAIRLALAEAFLTGDEELKRSALHTLDAYARSGMRDHVNGGFFRYSVNRALTVPHFEKMDYVQAALLQAYLDAYRLTGDSAYAAVARDIMRYVDSTLSDRERGGFYAHQDADVSLDDDGSYYTWSLAQLEAALAPEQAEALRLYYEIEAGGEMREDPSQNVPRIARSYAEVAEALGIPEAEARRRIRQGTQRLEAARVRQKAPYVETTKYTDRNGMMISAYLDVYETLGDRDARDFALKTLDLLLEHAVQPDGRVFHATADGESYVDGLMADYAFLTDALLDAYQVTGQDRYLRTAERVMSRAVEIFWDEENGGFFDRPADPDALGLVADRTKEFTDSPIPGDNAVAARALNKLYQLTSRDQWRERAEETLAAFAAAARESGTFAATYALAAEAHVNKPPQTVIIGPRGDHRTAALATAAWRSYRPGRMVATYDPSAVSLDSLPPAVAGAARVFGSDPTPRAYVCVGETCAPPTTDPGAVAELVRDYGRVGPR